MGPSWVPVRTAVAAGTLRSSDKGVSEVASRFDALLRYASLKLGKQLGTEVVPVLTRKELAEPALRTESLVTSLCATNTLEGAIRIPNAVGPLVVIADLRGGRITCQVDVDAPRDGRPATRVNWLIRQLRNAPEDTRIEAQVMHARGPGIVALLSAAREDPGVLIGDPKKDIRAFRIAQTVAMGTKRTRGRGSFIDSALEAVDSFYGDVVQSIKAWSAAPPKLREVPEQQPVPVVLTSTALSSQDGPEVAMDGAASAEDGQADSPITGTTRAPTDLGNDGEGAAGPATRGLIS